jgi:hypothetical protein
MVVWGEPSLEGRPTSCSVPLFPFCQSTFGGCPAYRIDLSNHFFLSYSCLGYLVILPLFSPDIMQLFFQSKRNLVLRGQGEELTTSLLEGASLIVGVCTLLCMTAPR